MQYVQIFRSTRYKYTLSYNETMNASINSNIATRSLNHRRRGKEISITYSEYVPAALVMHLAKSMHPVISSSVTFPSLPYFSPLSHTARFSGGKNAIL